MSNIRHERLLHIGEEEHIAREGNRKCRHLNKRMSWRKDDEYTSCGSAEVPQSTYLNSIKNDAEKIAVLDRSLSHLYHSVRHSNMSHHRSA